MGHMMNKERPAMMRSVDSEQGSLPKLLNVEKGQDKNGDPFLIYHVEQTGPEAPFQKLKGMIVSDAKVRINKMFPQLSFNEQGIQVVRGNNGTFHVYFVPEKWR
jgi:hypothetical protein